jgi:hypothetical protein
MLLSSRCSWKSSRRAPAARLAARPVRGDQAKKKASFSGVTCARGVSGNRRVTHWPLDGFDVGLHLAPPAYSGHIEIYVLVLFFAMDHEHCGRNGAAPKDRVAPDTTFA